MLSNFSLQKWISQICHFGVQQRREGVEAVELVDFTSDGNLKHLEWLEDHLALVSADDVVKHQQWTENHIDTVVVVDNVNHQKWAQNHGHLTSSDEPVKHLEWLYNQKSLNSYIDQVHNLELLENHLDLTPTADSVHVELLKNIGGLTAAADPVKYLEWLVNNRELTMFIKNQIHTLKLEMGFLRTYLKGMEGKDMVHKFRHEIKDFIQNTASELRSLCLRPETDGIVIRDLQLLVSSTLEKLNTYKPDIRFHYACTYLIARSDAPTKDEIIMELVVSLLENLKNLQSCKTDLIASVKTHIEALEEKLIYVRNFLQFTAKGSPSSWIVRPTDSVDGSEHEKFKNLLTHIEYVIDHAAYVSYFCLVDEVDEILRLKSNISYLVSMIKHIELEIKEIYAAFLKYSKSSPSKTLPMEMRNVVTIDYLLNNLMQMPNCKSDFVVPFNDKIVIPFQELRFLRALLMDPPPGKNIKCDVGAYINKARVIIESFHLDKAKEETENALNLLLFPLLEKIMIIKSEVRDCYFKGVRQSQFSFIGIDALSFIDLVLKNLDELQKLRADSIVLLKHQIESIHGELVSLRPLLKEILEKCYEHEMKDLMACIIEVAHEAEFVINSIVVQDGPLWYHMLWISELIEEFKFIKMKLRHILKERYFITNPYAGNTSSIVSSQPHGPKGDEVLVGFEDEAQQIIERLTGGSQQLDIGSIVGMPGLGKTTLAKSIYNDPLVAYHFYIRAWCCVSQTYQKRQLLLEILGHVVELTDKIYKLSDEDLAEKLYKSLKGRKYLIVMDDMWSISAWDDLRICFPNDGIGSRIMITSRIHEIASKAKPGSLPHYLRLFSEEESWKLMQEKLFQKEICPVELVEVGKEIAKKCKGLPLAVAVVAGLLSRMEKKKSQWEQVAESLNSLIVSESKQFLDILELSYMHLPNHLKPCFLYCGAFAASKEIPVQKLLRLWVAEGFVPKSELKSVEDIAEDYLMDLIGRSLITVDKTRSKGGVKTCHVHDLLRDLCLLKAKKENFLQMVNGYNELYALAGSLDDNASFHPSSPQPPRLCIQCKRADFIAWRPSDRHVCSLLFCATDDMYSQRWFYPLDFSFIFYSLKLLKVLDLSSINLGDSFPSGFEFLVHLRYLAVRGGMNFIPACIAKLLNLETLFVKGVKGEVALPDTIWKMANLRHVHIDERVSFILLNDRTALEFVETLCTPSLSYGKVAENLVGCFPNLRKLKCIFLESWNQATNCNQFPVLDGLSQLESLKVFYHGRVRKSSNFIFPSNLKKLTLTKFCLPWREISKVGTLPNLEVLKLLFRAFEGKTWDMRDGEFLKLKYLKLDSLNLEQWNASSDHFPCLQRLVLLRCKKLKEIPSDLGSVPTLQAIELQWCSDSAANSAKQIQEEQIEMGNEELMLLIQTVPKWPSK